MRYGILITLMAALVVGCGDNRSQKEKAGDPPAKEPGASTPAPAVQGANKLDELTIEKIEDKAMEIVISKATLESTFTAADGKAKLATIQNGKAVAKEGDLDKTKSFCEMKFKADTLPNADDPANPIKGALSYQMMGMKDAKVDAEAKNSVANMKSENDVFLMVCINPEPKIMAAGALKQTLKGEKLDQTLFELKFR